MYLGTVFGKPHLQHKRNEINETSSSPSRFGRDLLNKCCHLTRLIEKKENAHTRKDIQNWTLLNRNVINPYLNHIRVNNRINNHVLLSCLKHYVNFKHQSWATLFQNYNWCVASVFMLLTRSTSLIICSESRWYGEPFCFFQYMRASH